MKWLLVLATGLAVALGGVGCEDESDDTLVGTWMATAANGQPIEAGNSFQFIFRSDGTVQQTDVFAGVTTVMSGTWSTTENIVTLVEDGTGDVVAVPYVVSGDTLTIGPPGEVFTMTRQ